MVHCVALLANAGNGKTTAANYLVEKYDAQIVSLATPLKRCAKAVMKFSDAQLYGSQSEKERMDPRYGFSARTFLRLMGTEGLRHAFWPDIHIEALMKTLEREEPEDRDQLFICDDARFLNEARAFGEVNAAIEKPHHTAVVKIVCTDAPKPVGGHSSESEVDLVPLDHIAATVISSKAQGLKHLYAEIDRAFAESPRLAPFRRLLREGAARRAVNLIREAY